MEQNLIQQSIELTEEGKQYKILHNEIVQYGNMATTCFVQFMAKLKQMRDGKLYRAVGIETFGEYVEQQVGIKERQAYNYITAYENLSDDFLQSNAKLGITKLSLLAPLSEGERQQIMQEVDVENTSVSKLKEEIAARDQKIEQMQIDFDALQESQKDELEKVTAERDKLAGQISKGEALKVEVEKAVAEKDRMQKKLDKLSSEKQVLEQEISKLKNAPAKVETVENPETIKSLQAAQKRILELEMEQKDLTKKLQLANDETMLKFKTKFEDFQVVGQDILNLLSAMDPEKATKCKTALKAVVGGWNL